MAGGLKEKGTRGQRCAPSSVVTEGSSSLETGSSPSRCPAAGWLLSLPLLSKGVSLATSTLLPSSSPSSPSSLGRRDCVDAVAGVQRIETHGSRKPKLIERTVESDERKRGSVRGSHAEISLSQTHSGGGLRPQALSGLLPLSSTSSSAPSLRILRDHVVLLLWCRRCR